MHNRDLLGDDQSQQGKAVEWDEWGLSDTDELWQLLLWRLSPNISTACADCPTQLAQIVRRPHGPGQQALAWLGRLRQVLGKKIFAEFGRVAAGTPVASGRATSEQDYRHACLETGLRGEAKTAHFEFDRASIENSLRALLAKFAASEVVNRLLTPSRPRSTATHTCHSPNP